MSVYPILEKEISAHNIDVSFIAQLLGIEPKIFWDKLNGKQSFYFNEIVCIRDCFFPAYSLQELFIKK